MHDREKFTLQDAWGESHEYLVIQLPARKGLKLFNRLLTMLSGGVGLLLEDTASEGVDVTANVGKALETVAKGVVAQGDEEFWVSLLANVTRDGVRLSGVGLASTNFDKAYARNYGELARAIFRVLKFNFGEALKFEMGNLEGAQAAPEWLQKIIGKQEQAAP